MFGIIIKASYRLSKEMLFRDKFLFSGVLRKIHKVEELKTQNAIKNVLKTWKVEF